VIRGAGTDAAGFERVPAPDAAVLEAELGDDGVPSHGAAKFGIDARARAQNVRWPR
jgi:hypothetical protein